MRTDVSANCELCGAKTVYEEEKVTLQYKIYIRTIKNFWAENKAINNAISVDEDHTVCIACVKTITDFINSLKEGDEHETLQG